MRIALLSVALHSEADWARHSSDHKMVYRGKTIHHKRRSVIYAGKKNPFSHNKSTMEAQLWVSPQHHPYRGHCGRVFQEAAGEGNDSIWLKSAGDKSDTQIIPHTARVFRGTQSQSD